ncbi:MAG: exosome complex exonuclease Rrp41 [Marine Group III euryarchaeote CG-Bathy1]|uniref:Exosome complex exonuclease Rrp41 n=1 Tax=Marine Group III euryarchaeote CG-Bathy1 TaxID=1889001 RepID=A0A1J5T901_9ARCH|nr:MAG: exosome complex exonuclease Rrp41 [Marine Group III euryarchaeote CG-Bathy1]
MGGKFDKEFIDKKGKRMDGRAPNELRPLKIEAGVLDEADGSSYLEWGNNKVYCGVFGPIECHPRHKQKPDRAIIQARYNMAPFSVDDRKRPGLDRRSTEIGLLISEALERVVMVEKYPKAAIRVDIQVVEAHAGTRCAALTAASVAVADAGIPMKDLVPSCATGKVDGKVVLDLNKEEDNFGEADLPLAVLPSTEEVVLMQMDGELTPEEFEEAFDMAIEGCKQVYEIQRDALKRKYGGK